MAAGGVRAIAGGGADTVTSLPRERSPRATARTTADVVVTGRAGSWAKRTTINTLRVDRAVDDLRRRIGEHSWHCRDRLDHVGDSVVQAVTDRQADLHLGAATGVSGVVHERIAEHGAIGDVNPPAVPRLEHDRPGIDLAHDPRVVEDVDVVADLDRTARLEDNPGGEVLGDAAPGEEGDDATMMAAARIGCTDAPRNVRATPKPTISTK
jgi:hypothetical protein